MDAPRGESDAFHGAWNLFGILCQGKQPDKTYAPGSDKDGATGEAMGATNRLQASWKL